MRQIKMQRSRPRAHLPFSAQLLKYSSHCIKEEPLFSKALSAFHALTNFWEEVNEDVSFARSFASGRDVASSRDLFLWIGTHALELIFGWLLPASQGQESLLSTTQRTWTTLKLGIFSNKEPDGP